MTQDAMLDPFANALFLIFVMSIAGVAHACWLRSPLSQRFASPIDFGVTFWRHPLFGKNKTWRGLMVMPPACAAVFYVAAITRHHLPAWLSRGMWDLSPANYAQLGLVCGLAFMLAELPNSFFKRQIDVAPGMAPRRPLLAALCFVIDRLDSVVGVLLALTLLVPMSLQTWLWVLVLGPGVHWLFSVWLYRLKVKARPL